jgi:hypothetical protein
MSDEKLTIARTIDYLSMLGKSEKEIVKEVDRLIKLGDDVNLQVAEEGMATAVQNAARLGQMNTLKLLIANGADITLKNKFKEDIKLCAKLSENKEMIAFVNEQLKLTKGVAPINYVYYKPRKNTEAEYTFTPNKKYKEESGSSEKDVGYFLNDSEVLVLEPTKSPTPGKTGVLNIAISEGKVSIHSEQWEELTIKKYETLIKSGKVSAHDIESIGREYLSS